jgi:Tetracyclin repressor-like, C-terminal domain
LSNRRVALGLDQLTLLLSVPAFEAGLREYGPMSPANIHRYSADIHAFFARLPADRYPVLAEIAPEMTGHDGDAWFTFGLDVLIAGLEAVSAATA